MCWPLVLWSILGALAPGGAQYWDREGLSLPAPSAPPSQLVGLQLTYNLRVSAYDSPLGGEAGRSRRMTSEQEVVGEDASEEQKPGRRISRIAVVGKCCPMGQNLSSEVDQDGSRTCTTSAIPFQPIFFDFNATGIWEYESNQWETIVGNPCSYGRYLLDPAKYSEDEFYLLRNGSLIAPYHKPPLLHSKDFCMEAFWSSSGSEEALVLPLVCFSSAPKTPAGPHSAWDFCIAIVTLASVPFLVVTSVAHLCLKEVWAAKGTRYCRILGTHTTFLAMAFFFLAITKLTVSQLSHDLCIFAAYTIQFCFLSFFFWLNILCVDTYLNVVTNVTTEEEERHQCVCKDSCRRWWSRYWWLWGWVGPIFITLVTLFLDRTPGLPTSLHKPNFGRDACWFQSDASIWFYFYGPITFLLVVNIVLFIATLRSLNRQDRLLNTFHRIGEDQVCRTDPDIPRKDGTTGRQRWQKYKKMFKKCLILFGMMGLSWIMEVLSFMMSGTSSWYLSDLINAVQGFIIFYVFMKRPILHIVWAKLEHKFPWESGGQDRDVVVSERTSIGCNGVSHPV